MTGNLSDNFVESGLHDAGRRDFFGGTRAHLGLDKGIVSLHFDDHQVGFPINSVAHFLDVGYQTFINSNVHATIGDTHLRSHALQGQAFKFVQDE